MGYKTESETKKAKDTNPQTLGTDNPCQMGTDSPTLLTTGDSNQSVMNAPDHMKNDGANSLSHLETEISGITKSQQLGANNSSQLGTEIAVSPGIDRSQQSGANSSSQLGTEIAVSPGINRPQQSGACSSSHLGTQSGLCSEPRGPQRVVPERPHSAHLHRVCGRLLRLIGDDYLCSSCGKTLQLIGDAMTTEYAIRKAASCNDLENLSTKR